MALSLTMVPSVGVRFALQADSVRADVSRLLLGLQLGPSVRGEGEAELQGQSRFTEHVQPNSIDPKQDREAAASEGAAQVPPVDRQIAAGEAQPARSE